MEFRIIKFFHAEAKKNSSARGKDESGAAALSLLKEAVGVPLSKLWDNAELRELSRRFGTLHRLTIVGSTFQHQYQLILRTKKNIQ